jgi:HPt (histidine-containing phosphotransfer) domain-containing protein
MGNPESGMDEFVLKPVNPEQLTSTLKSYASSKSSGTQPKPTPRLAATAKTVRFDSLMEIADGSLEFIDDLVSVYLDSLTQFIEAFPVTMDPLDFESLKRQSHKIKGSSASITADVLADLFGSIADSAAERQEQLVRDLLSQLPRAISTFKNAFQSAREQNVV